MLAEIENKGYSPESLTTNTANKVTSAIFLDRLVALRTRFGMDGQPIYCLRLVFALLVPQCPHVTGTGRVRFSHAVEAKLLSTYTLDLTVWLPLQPNSITTMRSARAPLHFSIVFYVRLQKEPLITFNRFWVFRTHQLPYFVFVTNCTTLVLHTSHASTLTILYFYYEVLSPA